MSSATTWTAMVAGWEGSDRLAIIEGDRVWSGAALMGHAARAAGFLDSLGCRPGEPVPALVESTASTFASLIAGAATRRPLAPLGPRHTVAELAPCLANLGSESVLVAEERYLDVAHQLADRTGCRVALLDLSGRPDRRLPAEVAPTETAFILHTSGTTGLPKPVPYRQDRMAGRARLWALLCSLTPSSVLTTPSPFHHLSGVGNYGIALAIGAALVPLRGFDIETWRTCADHGVTNALLIPTMIEMLLDADALRCESLRYLHYGGAPMRPPTIRRVLDVLPGVEVVNLYGQTEGSPLTFLSPEDHRQAIYDRPELLRSSGRPVPGLELRIQGAVDGVGEVCCRAAHLMAPDSDGWLRTGDLGHVDGDGYVYLVGRKGDKIVRGGENIYPVEVETVIDAQPGVRECAVIGVADPKWGEIVKAFVVPVDAADPPAVEVLRAATRAQLSGFKVPVEWEFVDQLPRNPSGKVLRRVLVQRSAAS